MTGSAQRLKKHYEKHEYGSSDQTACEEGPSASKQSEISDLCCINKIQQQKFDMGVEKFFFANNIPFEAVKSG